MKRTTLGIFSLKSYLDDFKKYRALLVLLTFFLCGLLFGAMFFRNADRNVISALKSYITENLFQRREYPFFKILCVSLVSFMPFFFSAFLFGLSPVGVAFVPAAILLRGSGIGLICGYLYKNYAIKGVAFSLLILMPAFLFSSFVFLLAGCDSLHFSGVMLRAFSTRAEPVSFQNDFRIYLGRYLFYLLMSLICSLVDTVFTIAFIRFF